MTPYDFLAIVGVTLVAEIPDKSMVAAVLLSRRAGTMRTLSAAIVALGVQSVITAEIANVVRTLISPVVLSVVSAWVMIGIGSVLWFVSFRKREDDDDAPSDVMAWWKISAIFFLAELGDITQVTTAGFALKYGDPLLVALGSTLGMAGALSLASWAGTLTRRLSTAGLYRVGGSTLALLGIVSIVTR
ncbi:MAG: TMEM165/GDT1 family protein [Ferrimicrobium sp.]